MGNPTKTVILISHYICMHTLTLKVPFPLVLTPKSSIEYKSKTSNHTGRAFSSELTVQYCSRNKMQ
ncbi:hypothetical protein A2U01_0029651 [Trifolium medium]|uniref:Uncharacterized protein n=1 Tax=Trifolium medium TaxID=97028 RepID=A0A392P9W5_9FABA|nr:hypothetical protein [Trifolium medium]